MSVKVYVSYGYGTQQRNNYSVVEADTIEQAREEIHRVTRGQYAFAYDDEAQFQEQIRAYGLTEIPLRPQQPLWNGEDD